MRGAEEDNINGGDNFLNVLQDDADMILVVPELEMNPLENINALHQSTLDITSENMENISIYSNNQPVEVDEDGH